MSWFRKSSSDNPFPWIPLTSEDQFLQILKEDQVAIFKHSTRCSISTMAKNRLERGVEDVGEIPFYYLDLLKFRNISNKIEEILEVRHQSPQLIVVKNGEVVYHASHNSISIENVLTSVS